MAEKKGTSGGGVIAIAAVAFGLGRISATPDGTVVAAPAINVSDAPTFEVTAPADTETAAPEPVLDAPAEPFEAESPEPAVDDESVYYARCADARAAGAAPIHEGEPGYAPHLDRDGDGVACE